MFFNLLMYYLWVPFKDQVHCLIFSVLITAKDTLKVLITELSPLSFRNQTMILFNYVRANVLKTITYIYLFLLFSM